MPAGENKFVKFVLAVAAQFAVIVSILVFNFLTLAGGREVLLKIAPVDPRDWLRGDYVTFEYDISNIEAYLAVVPQIRNGDTVYVVLRKTGKYWTAMAVQKDRPKGGEPFIRGKVASGGAKDHAELSPIQLFDSRRLHIVYGIEQYFVQEGKGANFNFWDKEVAARVVIDDNGGALLKKIYVDGKVWPQ